MNAITDRPYRGVARYHGRLDKPDPKRGMPWLQAPEPEPVPVPRRVWHKVHVPESAEVDYNEPVWVERLEPFQWYHEIGCVDEVTTTRCKIRIRDLYGYRIPRRKAIEDHMMACRDCWGS